MVCIWLRILVCIWLRILVCIGRGFWSLLVEDFGLQIVVWISWLILKGSYSFKLVLFYHYQIDNGYSKSFSKQVDLDNGFYNMLSEKYLHNRSYKLLFVSFLCYNGIYKPSL